MEEHRIGVMYWNLFKRWIAGFWDGLFPRGLRRSNALLVLGMVAIIGIPGLGYYLHTRGRFHALKNEIKGNAGDVTAAGPRPGGLDPLVLTRAGTPGSNVPELRSVTLLPGLGMDVLQMTATLPDGREVALLAAPSVEAMADGAAVGGAGSSGAGPGAVRTGQNDTHGAIEVPWSGMLTGLLSPVGTSLRTTWKGRTIEAPTDVQGRGVAYGGMLAGMAADDTQTPGRVEGPAAVARFQGTSFDEHWASKTEVTVTVALAARAVELTVTAKNVGDQPEPMGLGWHPRFVIPSGDRARAEVRLPGGEMMEIADRAKGVPSGRIGAAGAGLARFQGRAGALGEEAVDEAVVNPKAGLLDTGSQAEVRDPASGLGIRMTGVSGNIREFRVSSPAGATYVGLGTQTNLDDPLGKEWNGAATPAIMTLMPGQTVEWKVRVEVFSVGKR